MTEKSPKAGSDKTVKEERLAEALRANLARRKAQGRARAKPPAPPERTAQPKE